MPIEVDVEERLREIATATLAVVREHGAQGVTIRSVAQALGGSTTRVTNYLPSRSALLMNAVNFALSEWDAQVTETLDGVPDADRLRALSAWLVTTDPSDPIVRQLFLELLSRSNGNDEVLAALRRDVKEEMQLLEEQAEKAGADDPAFVAEVLMLITRGFYLSSLESPEVWTSEKAVAVVERAVAMLLSH